MIKFICVGQQLRIATPVVVSDTINYLTASAQFDGDAWMEEGLSKWAHFSLNGETYDIPFFGDVITEEQGLNLGAGLWEVYLSGTALEDDTVVTRITTTTALLDVKTAQSPSPFPPLTPSFAEIVATLAQQAVETANLIKAKAENGEFNGATFYPTITEMAQQLILSWTNDKGYPVPDSVNIRGPKGDPGLGLVIKGYFATLEDLEAAVPVPEINDVYGVGSGYPYDIYVWDDGNNVWVNNGPIQGPPGIDGEPGRDGEPGADGYTPVKGEDYFTPDELAQTALAASLLVSPTAIGAIPDPPTKVVGQGIVWNGTKWVGGSSGVASVNGRSGVVTTSLLFSNKSVPVSSWTEMGSPTYSGFPFVAPISLSGALATDIPIVVFNASDAVGGNFCPVAESYGGGVYIYAKTKPSGNKTIKSILLVR